MKSQKLIAKIFIGVFVAMLCAPSIEQAFNIVPIDPVVESRAKVPLPPGNPLVELWQGQGYFSDYEKHFNDVFGFRDFFIRSRNQIQYSIFHDSDQIIVGRDGWLVDKPSVDVEQRTVDALSEADWKTLAGRLTHLNRILRHKGIYFLVIPVPFKNTVYPEFFPETTARRPAITGYARFVQLLADNDVPFVDAYGILEKHKSVGVYYRTDLHWNVLGAKLVAVQTVDQLARALGRNVHWRYPDTTTLQPLVGGVDGNDLAIFWPPQDINAVPFAPGDSCGPTTSENTPWADASFVNHCHGPVFPPALFLGNSFALQMKAAGLQDHFAKVTRVYDIQHFGNLLADIRPGMKIVIWQNFELEIGYQMQNDDFWRDVDSYRDPR
jgi:hypothetical protein